MPRLLRSRSWGVRATLLIPMLVLVLLSAAANRAIQDTLSHRQNAATVAQRGSTVLTSVTNRLDDRRQSEEHIAQLLAAEPGLAPALARADTVAAAQLLLPLQTQLDLGFIGVYADSGQPILRLGAPNVGTAEIDRLAAPLLVTATSGLTQSVTTAGVASLVALAATPVKEPQGIVGVLVVGTALDGAALHEIAGSETVELALFQTGRLVSTTADPEIARVLADVHPDTNNPGGLAGAALAPFHFYPTGRLVGADSFLLVLVPTGDLDRAHQQRELIEIIGTVTLVTALLLTGLLLAWRIAKPLRAAVIATAAAVAGDYRQRVPSSGIRELDDLAYGLNHLAERVAGQLADLRQRNEHLAALSESGRALAGELDLDRALALAWAQIARVGGVADGWIALRDEAADALDFRLFVQSGIRRPGWEEQQSRAGGGLGWAVIDEGRPLCVPDYAAECRRRGVTTNGPLGAVPGVAWLGLPLVSGGRVIGALAAWRPDVLFTDQEVATLATLAGQITAALENARLYAAARVELAERVRAEAALKASEENLAAAQEIAHLGSWEVDPATGSAYWSDEAFRILGYVPGQIVPSFDALLAVVHPEDRERVARTVGETTAAARSRSLEYRIVQQDGTVRVVYDQSRVVDDAGQRRRIGAILDITERKALEVRLAHQAFHDPLTGLPNRALFLDRLGHALDRGRRDAAAVAVLLLDLDGFKYVNDSLGHAAGDRLLIAFAGRLPDSCLRPGDTLARLGGDEFAILLEGVRAADEAAQIAARITDSPALRAPYPIDGREVAVGASIGVVVGLAGKVEPAELLRDADIALYRAKAVNKGSYAIFDPRMNVEAVTRLELEADLRRAIERGELALAYQPLVALAEGRIVRAEALARWTHPERGPISPAVFVPIAEETGLIRPLGRWVLAEACRQAADWGARHGAAAPVVCVNLSAREFADPDLARQVAQALQDAGLDPSGLELEITEGVLMGDAPGTLATLWALHDLGVGLAIDDFGTGYSSLAYLKRFPVDTLKVDKAFVDGLGVGTEDTAITGAIVELAHALGLVVVAEGVETADQAVALRQLGCNLAQGYHFARPLAVADLDALLAAGPLPLPSDPGPTATPTPAPGGLGQRRAQATRLVPLLGGQAGRGRPRR